MKFFYNLKTSVKLISAFLLVSLILAFVGVYSLTNLSKLNGSLKSMYDDGLIPLQSVQSAQIGYTRMRVLVRSIYMADNKAAEEEDINQLEIEKKELLNNMNAFRSTLLSEESKAALEPFDGLWNEYLGLLDQAVEMSSNNQKQEMEQLIKNELGDVGDKIRDLLYDLIDINMAEADATKDAGEATYTSSRNISIAVIAISAVISILLGYIIAQIIARPLARVTQLVQQVASGNLRNTLDISTKDEIGQLAQGMNNMVLSLRDTVSNILSHAQSLAAASQQISASTEEIASGNASQASDAQTMNELFKDLSAAIHAVARNTELASELSNETVRIAEEGSHVVQTSSESMKSVSLQMTRLEDDSQRVGEIISVIEDIADQTNLLALNAAIEAARAGEQGRGFAVVADEVRKLAERSGEATKQITGIIKGMQENTRASVKSVHDSAELSERTGESFGHIVNYVNEAGQKVMEIAAASEQQAAQTSTVLTAIENISATTEEAAASSEETAATAQSLAQVAEELQQSVSTFKL